MPFPSGLRRILVLFRNVFKKVSTTIDATADIVSNPQVVSLNYFRQSCHHDVGRLKRQRTGEAISVSNSAKNGLLLLENYHHKYQGNFIRVANATIYALNKKRHSLKTSARIFSFIPILYLMHKVRF